MNGKHPRRVISFVFICTPTGLLCKFSNSSVVIINTKTEHSEGSDSLEKGGYGNNTGKASGTEWLLAQVWEHLQPAKPHVIGTLINDVESEDKLVPTELLVLTQLIMATMNMKRRVEYTVFPVRPFKIPDLLRIHSHFQGTLANR